MDKNEAEWLVDVLQRLVPAMNARATLNRMSGSYEVDVNGGDPRGVRVWLKSPRQATRYIVWLGKQGSKIN